MIKDKLAKAIQNSLENIKNGEDHIPLGMRGELEVIVKDREGNVLSYERDHNQVTKLAKMAIIHLLAGEIGTNDAPLYSEEGTSRAYSSSSADSNVEVVKEFKSANHTTSTNLDGVLVSGQQFFYNGSQVENISQISLSSLAANYPTKMLFGTGMEAKDAGTASQAYKAEIGEDLSSNVIAKINGLNSGAISFENASSAENWYFYQESSSADKCRTLQPATTDPSAASISADTTAIKGAIKNCLIHDKTADQGKYSTDSKAVADAYKGVGYPCFIYATRSTSGFYAEGENNEVYYTQSEALQNVPYETELVYTVVMPAQPVSSDLSSYYPYNGWVLKQAGLFCDSRYELRSTRATATSDPIYTNSAGGQLLFVRNLSSPILKTADNEVVFKWHIFITV